jgi:hypothetical protein
MVGYLHPLGNKGTKFSTTSRHCKEIGKLAQYAFGPFID